MILTKIHYQMKDKLKPNPIKTQIVPNFFDFKNLNNLIFYKPQQFDCLENLVF